MIVMAQSEAEGRKEAVKRKSEAPVKHLKALFTKIEERALQYLGLLGIFFLLFGFMLTTYQTIILNWTPPFGIHLMVATFLLTTVGFTLVIVALILNVLKMLKDKIVKRRNARA